jgi:hypothetical protein
VGQGSFNPLNGFGRVGFMNDIDLLPKVIAEKAEPVVAEFKAR